MSKKNKGRNKTNTNAVAEEGDEDATGIFLYKVKDLKSGVLKPLDAEQAKRGLLWLRKAKDVLEATEGIAKDGVTNHFFVYLALDELIVDVNARAAWESVDTKEDRLKALKRWFSSPAIVEMNKRRVESMQRGPNQSVLEFVNSLVLEYKDTFLTLTEAEICDKVLSGSHWPVEAERDRMGYDSINTFAVLKDRARNISAVEVNRKRIVDVSAYKAKEA
jgi:hypothetical protein